MSGGIVIGGLLLLLFVCKLTDRVLVCLSLPYARYRHRKVRSWKARFIPHDPPLAEQERSYLEWKQGHSALR